jgi:hypothetical protein
MLLLCWVVLLGMVDMWATKHYFGRLQRECLVEQAKLRAEAQRLQSLQGNGRGGKTHPATKKDER